jgi:hypothetical protein
MPETPPVALDDLALILENIRIAKHNARSWSEVAETLMADVKARVGEAEVGTVGGEPVVRHSVRTVTRLDSKRLRAELPEPVLAPYLNVSTEHRYELVEVTGA